MTIIFQENFFKCCRRVIFHLTKVTDRSFVVSSSSSGNSPKRRGLHTGGLSCKFLYTFSRLRASLDCLGYGTTTGRSEHHRAPNTLPTQTMMTSHSALQYDKAVYYCSDLMEMKNNTQYVDPLWIGCWCKLVYLTDLPEQSGLGWHLWGLPLSQIQISQSTFTCWPGQ